MDERLEGVITAAVLVGTAYRLRDERGLVLALRRLVGAVERWQRRRTDTRPSERDENTLYGHRLVAYGIRRPNDRLLAMVLKKRVDVQIRQSALCARRGC